LTACRQKKAPRRAEAEAEKSRGPHWVERKNPDSVSARRKTRSKRIQLGVNRLGRDMERNHITANNEPMTAATGAKVAMAICRTHDHPYEAWSPSYAGGS
jgi:hypothetical protein